MRVLFSNFLNFKTAFYQTAAQRFQYNKNQSSPVPSKDQQQFFKQPNRMPGNLPPQNQQQHDKSVISHEKIKNFSGDFHLFY